MLTAVGAIAVVPDAFLAGLARLDLPPLLHVCVLQLTVGRPVPYPPATRTSARMLLLWLLLMLLPFVSADRKCHGPATTPGPSPTVKN